MRKMGLLVLILLLQMGVSGLPGTYSVMAQPDPGQVVLMEVASGFTRPLYVTTPGDNTGRLFVVEQDGRIEIIQNGSVLSAPFLDVSTLVSRSGSEQGLLGLAFHPNYSQNGWFFINYTDQQGDTVVARYTVSGDPNVADAASATTVLTVDQPYTNHNGGDLVFGPDGFLYIGLGDGGSGGDPQNRAQNPQTLLGKILRINADQVPYSIPPNNPAVNNPALLPEIWALGLRNPWRFTFDRATGDLYIADVGQNAWEEVNFQAAGSAGGENYGWNVYEGTHSFRGGQLASAVMPFAEYDHGQGCSITGGYAYRGAAIPALQGIYLYGDFCSGMIWSAYRDGSGAWQNSVFMDTDYNISSFGEDQQGELYLVDHGGAVLRFQPTTPPPSSTPLPTATLEPTVELPTVTAVPTELPTSTPEPTLPSSPAIQVEVTPASANPGETITVNLSLFNVTDLYGLQTQCLVNPAVLVGNSHVDGDGFNAANSYFVDKGFQPDGSWLVAASRLQPNGPISGNAVAFSLTYTVQGAGSSPVACTVLGVDQNGGTLALDVINGEFNAGTPPTETPVPTVSEPTIAPTLEPTLAPTLEPTLEPTIEPTVEVPTLTPPAGLGTIQGVMVYQNRPDNAGIRVQLLGADGSVLAELVTNADGAYQFTNVPTGSYSVLAQSPQHLSLLQTALVDTEGQVVDLGQDILRTGDTDDNGVVDLTDASFVGANFEIEVPPAPTNADLNGDNQVNVSDLALVGANFDLRGPIMGE